MGSIDAIVKLVLDIKEEAYDCSGSARDSIEEIKEKISKYEKKFGVLPTRATPVEDDLGDSYVKE